MFRNGLKHPEVGNGRVRSEAEEHLVGCERVEGGEDARTIGSSWLKITSDADLEVCRQMHDEQRREGEGKERALTSVLDHWGFACSALALLLLLHLDLIQRSSTRKVSGGVSRVPLRSSSTTT